MRRRSIRPRILFGGFLANRGGQGALQLAVLPQHRRGHSGGAVQPHQLAVRLLSRRVRGHRLVGDPNRPVEIAGLRTGGGEVQQRAGMQRRQPRALVQQFVQVEPRERLPPVERDGPLQRRDATGRIWRPRRLLQPRLELLDVRARPGGIQPDAAARGDQRFGGVQSGLFQEAPQPVKHLAQPVAHLLGGVVRPEHRPQLLARVEPVRARGEERQQPRSSGGRYFDYVVAGPQAECSKYFDYKGRQIGRG